jgi:hypothetical protein
MGRKEENGFNRSGSASPRLVGIQPRPEDLVLKGMKRK